MHYHLTLKSANGKTGPIPVTTSHKGTCPPACPMLGGGCYARTGPVGIHWVEVTKGKRGTPWKEFVGRVRSIPAGSIWRHNQAGDLPGKGNVIAPRMMRDLINANRGKRGFTYTHKPMTPRNRALVKEANANGFTVNMSADTLSEADELAELGVGPVVVVMPRTAPATSYTPKGRKVVICPAQQRDTVTCKDCGICVAGKRSVIVGFLAHGRAVRKVEAVCGS
jgi:hypothetical protein